MRVIGLVLACLLLLFLSGTRADRLSLSAVNTATLLTVVITLNDITDEYRFVSVFGCAAMQTEEGVRCTGDYERESSFEVQGRKQYLVDWRHVPKTLIAIEARAFDAQHRVLAKGTIVVLRGA